MSQYIGKTISLISVTDNRYVGLLKEIDSEKGTVTLSNVRCFGTEGRKNWGPEEIFPNPTIYQSVQFNGNDVKDLSILEVRLEDVHPILPPTANQLSIVSPPSASTTNATASQQQQQQSQNQNSANNVEQTSGSKNIPAAVAGYGVYAPTHTSETEATINTTSARLKSNDNNVVDDTPQDKNIDVTTDSANVNSDAPAASIEHTYNAQQRQQRNHYSHSHSYRPRNQKIEIPNSDFDFASSNAKFLKENPTMALDKQETSPDNNDSESTVDSSKEETFYNKKSSFFDTISTSAEINTNMRWQEEKELNMDTFGQVSIRPRFHSNRGRGRGNYRGRGRGNYRGRGRGGSNNNNSNYRGGYHNNNYRNNNNGGGFHNNFDQSNQVPSFQNQPSVEF
ncbi:hypothetical protein RI543_001286 [Arxiozyma heterogenica]|uniref:Scd6p n=1 Tax=Arxiozyma heterogenica TaxID=278026 RepID=A0AAN7ZSY4_9SACH|nr:hypothetical protein RI543_001286 [Kazachstania heterogenica]